MITDETARLMLDAVPYDLCSLHVAYSATGANEVSGGSPAYARKAITLAPAIGRSRTAIIKPVFNVPAATTIQFIGLWAGAVFRGMFTNEGDPKHFSEQGTFEVQRVLIRVPQ